MKNKKTILLFLLLATVICNFTGCTGEDRSLIAEFSVSPNEDYVKDEKDRVYYTVSVYKKDGDYITVDASSNFKFFKEVKKDIRVNKKITKDDIKLEWKNMMGNDKTDQKNQIAVAKLEIDTGEGKVFEMTINFVKNAVSDILSEGTKK